MVTVKYMIMWMERCGLINCYQINSFWRRVYMVSLLSLVMFRVSCQIYNLVTRCTRYLPEFVQVLVEICYMVYLIYGVFFYRKKNRQLAFLSNFMDNDFSKADIQVMQKCHQESNLVCVSFFGVVTIAISGGFLETMIPLSESELEIRRDVYRTKYPERRLAYSLRIPFIDETESWAYEFIYAMDATVMFIFIWWVSLAVSLVPVITIHMTGQYQILCKYISLIGREHRDTLGRRIFYSNIEKNEYYIKMYSPRIHKNKLGSVAEKLIKQTKYEQREHRDTLGRRIFYSNIEKNEYYIKMYSPRIHKNKLGSVAEKLIKQTKYEQKYMGQIIKFHKKLLTFQSELVDMTETVIVGLVLSNSVMISLCLYQLVVSSENISAMRYFKFAGQLTTVFMEYYLMCNCSEILDDCHAKMRLAIIESRWDLCTNQTRRDLCILTRRVQMPNHMRWYGGAVVGSRLYFYNVLKLAYKVVNFFRINVSSNSN